MIAIGSRTATLVHGVTLPLPLPLPALARYPWIDRGSYAWADIADLAALCERYGDDTTVSDFVAMSR